MIKRRRATTHDGCFVVLMVIALLLLWVDNGDKIKHIVLQLAEVVDKRLKDWICESMDFPNTMVDRITPATEQDHKSILAKDHRILDRVRGR